MPTNCLRVYGRKTALKLSLLINLALMFLMIVSLMYAKSRDLAKGVNVMDVITTKTTISFLANMVILYILFLFEFWVVEGSISFRKKIAIGLFGSLGLVLVLSPVSAHILWWFSDMQSPLNLFLILSFVKDMILLIITLLFTALIYTWHKGQQSLMLNQKLSIESLQNRYEALKNQLDPHFLFNSLNTLNGLIGYDSEKASEYLDQLSFVFRYTMQNKKIVKLEDEIIFTESYIYLMKIRYDESLKVELDIDEEYAQYYILPLGLQLLIENAIKHNVVSKKYPLLIRVETTGESAIRVQNSLRPKPDHSGAGIGLANLNERCQLMFDKPIHIVRSETAFAVEIPLIKEIDRYKNKLGEESE